MLEAGTSFAGGIETIGQATRLPAAVFSPGPEQGIAFSGGLEPIPGNRFAGVAFSPILEAGSAWPPGADSPGAVAAGTPAPTYLGLDRFLGYDGQPIVQHPLDFPLDAYWTRVSFAFDGGVWTIQSNKLSITDDGANSPNGCILRDFGSADGTLSVTGFSGQTNNHAARLGFIFRYVDSSNYWSASWVHQDAGISIYEVASGVATRRAFSAFTYADNTTYAISLVLAGASISFTLGATNVSYGSAATGLTATRHGPYMYYADRGAAAKPTYSNFAMQ